jgi:hypothetical protein
LSKCAYPGCVSGKHATWIMKTKNVSMLVSLKPMKTKICDDCYHILNPEGRMRTEVDSDYTNKIINNIDTKSTNLADQFIDEICKDITSEGLLIHWRKIRH